MLRTAPGGQQDRSRILPALLDLKLGKALLRDRRVPLPCKMLAFALGIAVVAILEFIEFPLEEIIAMIPFLGIFGDVAVDGLEMIFLPILLACFVLPHLAPSTIVDRIRREINGAKPPEGPIIDI
jgi:hypothetical protein